jgi:hypothetical protein
LAFVRPHPAARRPKAGAMLITDWVFLGVLVFSVSTAIVALLADY